MVEHVRWSLRLISPRCVSHPVARLATPCPAVTEEKMKQRSRKMPRPERGGEGASEIVFQVLGLLARKHRHRNDLSLLMD